jgi:uncharacterized protein YcaQ
MKTPVFPRRAAAALFLERQHLRRPRARRFTAKNLLAFITDAGGLQIDSINVVDRAHYLTLWSRFDQYDRAAFDRLAYRRRALFEYWAHAACYVPTADFPAWRRAMLDRPHAFGWAGWLRKNRKVVALVEDAVRERGPLGTSDFEHAKGSTTGWWNWKPASHGLDFLWRTGRTAVHSRVHFQKRYDLAERVMPEALAQEPMSGETFLRWHIRRSLHAMGPALETDLRLYLTFPRFEPRERRRAITDMIRGGEIAEIGIDGDRGRWLCLARDLDALAAAGRRRRASEGLTLLSPFDSFMWHRDRVERLFGFNYRIEVYVPQPKRIFGYYVLPVFADGHFIGRADVKSNRQSGTFELKVLHLEPWFAKGTAPPVAGWAAPERRPTLERLGEAVRSLATFTGTRTVKLGRVMPAGLAREVRAAIA